MATGIATTTLARKVALNRTFKSSPDYTTFSIFKVGTGTTTPTVGDTDLQTPVNIDADTLKDFLVGYPILDETAMRATIRCFLELTEANGNTLTEFGIFNSDGTKKMGFRAVHTAITKNSSTQVSYVVKLKFP